MWGQHGPLKVHRCGDSLDLSSRPGPQVWGQHGPLKVHKLGDSLDLSRCTGMGTAWTSGAAQVHRWGPVLVRSPAAAVPWASGAHPPLPARESRAPATGWCFSSDWSGPHLSKLLYVPDHTVIPSRDHHRLSAPAYSPEKRLCCASHFVLFPDRHPATSSRSLGLPPGLRGPPSSLQSAEGRVPAGHSFQFMSQLVSGSLELRDSTRQQQCRDLEEASPPAVRKHLLPSLGGCGGGQVLSAATCQAHRLSGGARV